MSQRHLVADLVIGALAWPPHRSTGTAMTTSKESMLLKEGVPPSDPTVVAMICDVQRFSLHDGPGIRTTVFFKGCALACRWCHNPEMISFSNRPVYAPLKCIGCGQCVSVCSTGALRMGSAGVTTDYRLCRGCMQCTKVCPTGARDPAAVAYDADGLLDEVLRDRDFFGSDGGLTLSGGEPLLQAAFLGRFLRAARGTGLNVTVETAGHWPFEPVHSLVELIDLFLFDVKMIDPDRHRELTGRDNRLIQANLRHLLALGAKLQVRMPLVPGLNTDLDNVYSTAELLTSLGLDSITLLEYHSLGQSKLSQTQTPLVPLQTGRLGAQEMARIRSAFESRGIHTAYP